MRSPAGDEHGEAEEIARLRKQLREVTEERDVPLGPWVSSPRGPDDRSARAFVEAEKTAGRNVAQACELLEVSRSAFYTWRKQIPSARELSDRELAEKIRRIHAGSGGTSGTPRVHDELRDRAGTWAGNGWPA